MPHLTTTVHRRATLADVAQLAGVSAATVSRALKDDPRISANTREVIARAAEQLSYVPNQAARSLVMQATQTLALLVPDVTDPLHGQIIAGFEQEAALRGYSVSIANGLAEPSRERRSLQMFTAQRADGVALMGSMLGQREVVEALRPTPAVFINGEHPSLALYSADLPTGCIRADDATGVEGLVRHLVEQGCRRFAYLNGASSASNVTRRSVAARAVLAASRDRLAEPHLRTYQSPPDLWRAGAILAQPIVQDRTRPDAVICFDDKLALALVDAMRGANLRVPEDVAVVGFDDIPFAALANPRLTTVAQPSAEMGRLAAAMLLDAIEHGDAPTSVTLPVEVIIRESSRHKARVRSRDALSPSR